MNTSPSSRTIRRWLAVLSFFLAPHALSQTHEPVSAAVDHYLRTQIQGLPGQVTYSIGKLDPKTQLKPCDAFEPFLPTGNRLWGKATVGVRCLSPAPWTIYLPVQVNISGTYLITARPIPGGQPIGADDMMTRSGDLTSLPANVLTDETQALGKMAKNRIAAGQPLRSDFLTAPWAVQQGQSVRLVTKGSGFSVSSEGKALNNAVDGQVAQVRTNSGQTISGIARAGGVLEVSY
jgi:flagella basal body P-ring formation protein FlgA